MVGGLFAIFYCKTFHLQNIRASTHLICFHVVYYNPFLHTFPALSRVMLTLGTYIGQDILVTLCNIQEVATAMALGHRTAHKHKLGKHKKGFGKGLGKRVLGKKGRGKKGLGKKPNSASA